MKQNQSGFTLFEILFVLLGVAWLAMVIVLFYVVAHFIAKYW